MNCNGKLAYFAHLSFIFSASWTLLVISSPIGKRAPSHSCSSESKPHSNYHIEGHTNLRQSCQSETTPSISNPGCLALSSSRRECGVLAIMKAIRYGVCLSASTVRDIDSRDFRCGHLTQEAPLRHDTTLRRKGVLKTCLMWFKAVFV